MNDRRYIPRNFSPSADFPNESSAINPGLLNLQGIKGLLYLRTKPFTGPNHQATHYQAPIDCVSTSNG